ncbi:undecaprenyl-diphosphate phosphatase [Helicobacter pametensis]|uniref:undecaprenyl-diphosphate phosphatase n=1 Tax=Helicobacter pametensis TaxID=95149 RepID=UPI000487C3A2|nr:undecaprenyl-diphosphate phosphatase [Helicobacter pametensis]
MDTIHAVILGIVEGITEFLPVSSTGHMILASKLMGLAQSDFLKTFEVAIQLGSILAVLVLFWRKLTQGLDIWFKLAVGFVPTGILGLTLYKFVKDFFDPLTVAYMLIFGGVVFIVIEYFYKPQHKLEHLSEISYKKAFLIGLFQSLAMIPGTSRSGATIVGGLLLGLSRKCAAEFSFLLAIPTMFAATGYDLYKNSGILDAQHLQILLIGGFVAFITALGVIKIFVRFVSHFGYGIFGIYRIILGSVFLIFVL